MSDELGAKPHIQAGPFVHYCEHPGCKKWGSFGFAVGRGEPNWFCSDPFRLSSVRKSRVLCRVQ
ncbi:hypothetical protein CDO28_34550 (plasmid) [Sinorhizobium meliloti]|uniref:hypothetical protein n=1 Tax=Rhizobium meliloti TaxID=382 RepID=UPI000B4999D4|nr:hypothetical protein [Sinorhizobium meliloti]ASP76523.1 hypothetical protein CDO28_34550 [Sinorhizobium meliloti]MQW48114.1 hypothetical protein [Sinorhizobium meliloti]